jgi:pilus assembly protein CpaC
MTRQSIGSNIVRMFMVMLIVASFAVSGVMASKVDLLDASPDKIVSIPLGKAEVVPLGGAVADVLIANPAIVDVVALQSTKLYVSGLQVGDTNIIVLDAEGNVVDKIDIHVKYDLKAIQTLVKELFPDEDITVGSIHDQILLTGTVSNAEAASKVTNIVGHYVSDLQDEDKTADELISNLLQVRGKQQVTLQVRIIEAQRSVLKELGTQLNSNDRIDGAAQVFGVNPFASQGGANNAAGIIAGQGLASANPAAGALRIFKDSGLSGIGTIGLFINALEEQNLINVLAEPNLTTVSGEQAGFLAGGETPVPTGLDQRGNIVVEFRQFGVSLNFRPLVLAQDRISLQMNTEVSSINFENAIPTGTVQVPGFDVRRADTTVELPSGGSIMIAGLLQSEAVQNMSGLPGINETPVIGDLLKSDSFEREESELVVIITPYLVEPYAEQDRPQKAPTQKNNPLANMFEMNIRRQFDVNDDKLFTGEAEFGYVLN